jgi:hypothetical protein
MITLIYFYVACCVLDNRLSRVWFPCGVGRQNVNYHPSGSSNLGCWDSTLHLVEMLRNRSVEPLWIWFDELVVGSNALGVLENDEERMTPRSSSCPLLTVQRRRCDEIVEKHLQ